MVPIQDSHCACIISNKPDSGGRELAAEHKLLSSLSFINTERNIQALPARSSPQITLIAAHVSVFRRLFRPLFISLWSSRLCYHPYLPISHFWSPLSSHEESRLQGEVLIVSKCYNGDAGYTGHWATASLAFDVYKYLPNSTIIVDSS